MNKAPIKYIQEFIPGHLVAFSTLWERLDWVDKAGNRREYYCNDFGVPYTYGSGVGVRTYEAQPYDPAITAIRNLLESHTKTKFEVCFLNGYRDGKDQLGWHADDSPEMDDDRPIAIISLGAKREIYFRPNEAIGWKGGASIEHQPEVEKVWLESGSLCLMAPGMQDTHQHRIPKASYICGPRISLTFRGYVK